MMDHGTNEGISAWFGNRGYPIDDKSKLTYTLVNKNDKSWLFILDDFHEYESDNAVELYCLTSMYCEVETDFDATDFDWSETNLLSLLPDEDAPSFGYGLLAIGGDCGGAMGNIHDLIILNGEHLDEIEDYLRYQLEWSFLCAKNDQDAMNKYFKENSGKGGKLIKLGVFGHKYHIRTDWSLVELHEELPLDFDVRQKLNVIKQGEHKDDNS